MAAVLAKVQKELGPAAKISSAQRIRSGGAMGFFQREKFEVVVEIPDPSDAAAPAQPSPAQATPASLLELAEQVNEAEATGRGPGQPKLSTESDSFAEVLSRIAFQSHMTTQREDEEPQEAETPEAAPSPSPESGEDREETTALPAPTPARDEQPDVVIEDRPAFLDRTPEQPEATGVVPTERTRITDSPLAALGLPPAYIPPVASVPNPQALQKALVQSLEQLPKPPVVHPSKGSIIAVVGDRQEALELAEDIAHKYGFVKDEIVLASQNYRGKGAGKVLRTPRSADDSRRSWSRRPRPTIVAIENPIDAKTGAWAEQVLTALEPVVTYGVADATRKAEDIAAWAGRLGGVDCLAVNHVDATVSPASVLAAGIPVERIDGHKATPAYWAMLLTERLAAA